MQLPIPGVAYFTGQLILGTVALTAVLYDEATVEFPVEHETNSYTKFRYGGNAIEIIPTVNAMTWTGSVQVYRGPVSLNVAPISASLAAYTLAGVGQILYSTKPDKIHPFNMGCYCVSRPTSTTYEFHDVLTSVAAAELLALPPATGLNWSISCPSVNFAGLGDMEAVIYRIPNYSSTGNQFTIRSWSSIEYEVSSYSIYYPFARTSPAYDPMALALARRMFEELEVCVPFYENDGMWSRILAWIKQASSMGAYIPGPIGQIASGVGAVANGLELITL